MNEETVAQSKTDVVQTPLSTSSVSPIDEAKKVLEEIKKENAKQEELLKQRENMIAKEMLSGRSEAGFKAPEKTEADKTDEYIKDIFKGTGLNPLKPFGK